MHYFRKCRSALATLAVALMVLTCTSASRADLTFTGSDGTYGASATFSLSGGNLVIDLKNTGTVTSAGNIDILTGLFFDITGTPTLTGLSSATKGAGNSLVWTVSSVGKTDPLDYRSPDSVPAGTTSGGWDWTQSNSSLPGLTQHYGLGTAGFGLFNGDPASGGPGSPANFGIVESTATSFYDGLVGGGPNGDKNNSPLIKDTIRFVFASNLTSLNISNVRFQYGTELSEKHLPGTTPDVVHSPEPSTMAIAALGALGFMGYGLRRRSAK